MKVDPPFSWFLTKAPRTGRSAGREAGGAGPTAGPAAALARLQVFAATESKIPLSSFVYTKLLFKAFICSGQFHCSFDLSTLVLYRLFDGVEIFFLVVL